MIKARNTTTGEELETDSFDEAFSWGIDHIPGQTDSLCEDILIFKEEFEADGRTCFVDCQGRCYAETIEIWDAERWDSDSEEWGW